MSENYLSRERPHRKPPPHSHKNTIVWQFLQAVKPGKGELGDLIFQLRDRVDMPRHFPHRTALEKYMTKCRFSSGEIGRNSTHIYNLYYQFYQQVMHPKDESIVEFVPASALAKSGVTRKQLAYTIFTGLGLFSNPNEHWREGGKWVDSCYNAADDLISLFSKANNKEPST